MGLFFMLPARFICIRPYSVTFRHGISNITLIFYHTVTSQNLETTEHIPGSAFWPTLWPSSGIDNIRRYLSSCAIAHQGILIGCKDWMHPWSKNYHPGILKQPSNGKAHETKMAQSKNWYYNVMPVLFFTVGSTAQLWWMCHMLSRISKNLWNVSPDEQK